MKYKTKIEDVIVKSNYPIDIELVKKLINRHLPSCAKQVTIEGPLVDDDWEDYNIATVGELINKLKELPEDIPIEYNYAGMSVDTISNNNQDFENFYVHSAFVVSE